MPISSDAHRFIRQSAFFPRLTEDEAMRLEQACMAVLLEPGESICRKGWKADKWIGIVNGSIKIENSTSSGRHTTLTHFSIGSWFGEGTLLKNAGWPYDAVAVVQSEVVLMPSSMFDELLARNLGFNRFLLDQLNARLAQFVERCEHERLHDADHHVAHCLAEMIDPRLNPRHDENLTISQEALARLAGVSRPIVNRALHRLERDGLLKTDYRSITLLDPEGLRRFSNV